jgi:hypothetical protein
MSPELLRIYDVLGLGSVLERFDVLSNALEAFGLAVAADPAAEVPAETHACGACACCGRVLRPDRAVLRQVRLPEVEYSRDAALRGAGWDAYFERLGVSAGHERSMS